MVSFSECGQNGKFCLNGKFAQNGKVYLGLNYKHMVDGSNLHEYYCNYPFFRSLKFSLNKFRTGITIRIIYYT